MKQRLPRKHKKQVKKLVAAKSTLKMAMASLVSFQSYIEVATISAQPIPMHTQPSSFISERALKAAETVANAAQAISKILSDKPNSWRDFVK